MSPRTDRPGPRPGPAATALLGLSLLWLIALLSLKSWRASPAALWATVGLIAANFAAVLATIVTQKRLLVALNLVQLGLFAVVHVQVYRVLGPDHYRVDRPPTAGDWLGFTAAHVLRAADLLDVLEEHCIDLQNVRHESDLAGALLLALHLGADVFLLALGVRWVRRLVQRQAQRWAERERCRREALYAREPVRRAWEEWSRGPGHVRLEDWLSRPDEGDRTSPAVLRWAHAGCLCVCVALVGATAITGKWSAADWLLWPLDQILRVVDLGDAMQVFHWKLHHVPSGFLESTLAVAFRLLLGIYALRWLNRVHLKVLGRSAIKTVDDYVDALSDDDAGVRLSSAEALGEMGPTGAVAVPALAELLRDPDPEVRQAAGQALCAVGPAGVPALTVLLKDSRDRVRCDAAEVLGRMGRAAANAAAALAGRLGDEQQAVRQSAEAALKKIGRDAATLLVERYAVRGCPVRMALARVLWEADSAWGYRPEGRQTLRDLVEQLADADHDVRARAAEGLGLLYHAALPAVAPLSGALRDHSAEVRTRTAWALGRVGRDAWAAVPDLVARLSDPHRSVRRAAAEALGRIRPEARRASAELARLAHDPDEGVRAAAAEALDVIDPGWRQQFV